MSDERRNQLSIAELADAVSVVGVQGVLAGTPTSEMRERFGLGESSLYRSVHDRSLRFSGELLDRRCGNVFAAAL
jgi:hypothetical protein